MFPKALLKGVGRDQGPQLWFSSVFTPTNNSNADSVVSAPTRADLSRPASHVRIVTRYRVTFATAALTTLNSESPQNLLRNVHLYGNRARTGATVVWNGSGASLFGLGSAADASGKGAKLFITSSVAGTKVRVPRLSAPVGLTIGTGAGQFGGIASYDVEAHYDIPFGPFGGTALQDVLFSQRDPDWSRTMSIDLTFGAQPNAGTGVFGVQGATGTTAFTGYGGVGNPMVYVYLIPMLQNSADAPIINMYRPGVIQRNVQTPTTVLTSSVTNAQLALLQNFDTPKIWTKAGVIDAQGNFVTLSDAILTKEYLNLGGKPIVQLNDQWSQQGWYEDKIAGLLPQGYNLIDFVGGGYRLHWGRILRLKQSDARQFVLNSDITGAANQGGEVIQEQVLEEPLIVNATK